jgi:hypothetical protein
MERSMRTGSTCGLLALAMFATAAGGAPALAQGAVANHITPSREYDQLRAHSDAMQAADGGRLTPGDTRRLMAELAAARRTPPAHLTPADCGVPL